MVRLYNAADIEAAEMGPMRVYVHSDEYDGFRVITKAGTDVAVRLKGYKIPFRTSDTNIHDFDYDLREKEFKSLVEKVLGKVVIVIGDKKRLSAGPWIKRYAGKNMAEKLQTFFKEFVNTELSDVTIIAFASTRSGWKVAGYQLIDDNSGNYDMQRSMLKYAFEESQGIVYSKNK